MGFFFFSLQKGNIYLKDSFEYLKIARWFEEGMTGKELTGSGEVMDIPAISKRPPGYPFLIFILKKIWYNDLIVSLFQSLLGLLNFILLYRLLKSFLPGRKVHRWLIAGAIGFPAQLIYSQMVMSELLFQTSLFLGFYNLLIFLEKGNERKLLLYNFYVAAGVLIKPVMVYFWIPNLLFMSYLLFRGRLRWGFLYALIPLVTVLGMSLYNFQKTGYFHYSSMKAINLLKYNAKFTLYKAYSPRKGQKRIREIREKAKLKESFKAKTEYIKTEGFKIIAQHPLTYAKIHLKGVVHFLIDPGRFDFVNYFGLTTNEEGKGMLYYFGRYGYMGILKFLKDSPWWQLVYMGVVFTWNMLVMISLLLFLVDRDVSVYWKLSLLLLVGYVALVTGPVGASRYRVAVYPLLLFTLPFFEERLRKWGKRVFPRLLPSK